MLSWQFIIMYSWGPECLSVSDSLCPLSFMHNFKEKPKRSQPGHLHCRHMFCILIMVSCRVQCAQGYNVHLVYTMSKPVRIHVYAKGLMQLALVKL